MPVMLCGSAAMCFVDVEHLPSLCRYGVIYNKHFDNIFVTSKEGLNMKHDLKPHTPKIYIGACKAKPGASGAPRRRRKCANLKIAFSASFKYNIMGLSALPWVQQPLSKLIFFSLILVMLCGSAAMCFVDVEHLPSLCRYGVIYNKHFDNIFVTSYFD
jgi:hypothetical protein